MVLNCEADKNARFIIRKFTHATIEKEYRFRVKEQNLFDFGTLFRIKNYTKSKISESIGLLKYQYTQVFLNILTWKITPSINFKMDGKDRNLILNHDKILTNGFTVFWNDGFPFQIGEKLTIKARFLNIHYDKHNRILNATFLTKVYNKKNMIICKLISNLTMLEGSF
ncbi:MAG: hypothetical protein GF311_25300 [Candidatus Lokiarchaeota archaeon]|nr:hypothetical protein [Candidatus Lokiarchaeota archaeon]